MLVFADYIFQTLGNVGVPTFSGFLQDDLLDFFESRSFYHGQVRNMDFRVNTISLDSHTRGFKVSHIDIKLFDTFFGHLGSVVNIDFFFAFFLDLSKERVDMHRVLTFDGRNIDLVVKCHLMLIFNCELRVLPLIEL